MGSLRAAFAPALLGSFSLVLAATSSHAGAPPAALSPHPDGAAMVRVLGAQAGPTFAPTSGSIGALVELPRGQTATALGVEPVAPGIGRLRGDAAALEGFASAHPDVHMEVSPPLHLLLDHVGAFTRAGLARQKYGLDGHGVVVGVADTGIDITHPSFLDANGKTRIAWMIDFSLPALGKHPDVESAFGIPDSTGKKVALGAVFSADDINALLDKGNPNGPIDDVGHGTHVTSIAAGTGSLNTYSGIAPGATLVVARVTRGSADAIENDDLLRGVAFLYDRAEAMGKPAVVNLSLGGDFGPHDGTMLWERTLASFVGPDHPGRALVVAAGNSGSILDTPIHESVRATEGTTLRVPIATSGAAAGGVQVWVTLRDGAQLSVGLDGPDGTWIAPVDEGRQVGRNKDGYNAGVIFGSGAGSPVPEASRGAVVLWSGAWPSGVYWVTLKGEGTADLFLQTTGDAASSRPAAFAAGVREGTINLPATEPSLIAVGCTMNRPRWTSIAGGPVTLHVPALDAIGGRAADGNVLREPGEGEMCWFSSAGPTVTGVAKPEISAPGGAVAAAMSAQATPDKASSIFYDPHCPKVSDNGPADPRCLQIDARQAIAVGTSMSAPAVAGAVALLLQRDPTLTQGSITAVLQAGAHRFRGAAPFDDQGGPGELDVVGALDALDQMKDPVLALPSADTSWITLGASYVTADASTPLAAILELRTADGAHRADLFDPSRLHADLSMDGAPLKEPTLVRKGPGLYTFEVRVPKGHGGSVVRVGATFDGAPIVTAKSVPVASDIWTASYGAGTQGGCSCALVGTPPGGEDDVPAGLLVVGLGLVVVVTRRRPTEHDL